MRFDCASDVDSYADELVDDLGEVRVELLEEYGDEEDVERLNEIRCTLKVLDAELGGDSFETWEQIKELRDVYDDLPSHRTDLYTDKALDNMLDDVIDEVTDRLPDWVVIDRDETRDNLKVDYTEITILGDTYWYRG